MKKLLVFLFCLATFSVHAQSFSMLNFLYEGHPLDEYLIPSENNKCLLHYLSAQPIPKDWKIKDLSSPNCLKNGYHQVEIINGKKEIQEQLKGFFIDGFFVGKTPLNTSVLKRYTSSIGKQELFYKIEEDKGLEINYIGKASSKILDGKYSPFDACSPFSIVLLTDRKELLSRPETKENILSVIKSYAQIICPNTKEIYITATDNPSLTVKPFFEERLEKKGISNWKSVLPPSVQRIPNIVSNRETPPFFAVHVSSQTGKDFAFTDLPYPIRINKGLTKGWWFIDGDLREMDDFEKKKSGIGLNEKAGILEVRQAYSCSDEQCRDYLKDNR